ncbi:YqiA/YcfP family alpha/beta fold hydrolase [Denitrificimonas sp. JX-1]|uniref:YqiA/YcfP family alpha/beta fold hydrolase n=1 Tax=Denitrificimonas halotolerans TaxID=3098930 RepID=A0ABU5GUW1_9GAMM|nr:YqiA/YcfP family alpha/beta fold hydrolase [Denitrificimonas sp. JX-1]MDY7220066.1 YqiA/YcfP family alpha/beta fold hydrolase [Denitrificimonas sp. JX-1]
MCKRPSIVYIHGFNSSPASFKAQQVRKAWQQLELPEEDLQVPALHHHPHRAIAQLQEIIESLGQPVLVGSSLGGYYATYLAQRYLLKALLINPAVRPHRLFDNFATEQVNLYTGEQWLLTESHLHGLAALEVPSPCDPQRFSVWLQTGDETLDYWLAEQYYCNCSVNVQQGGFHGFENFIEHLPALFSYAGVTPSVLQKLDLSAFE